MLQAYVPNEGDRLGARPRGAAPLLRARADAPSRRRRAGRGAAPRCSSWPRPSRPRPCATSIGAYLDLAALLGQRTAEMHLALGVERRRRRASRPSPYIDARPALELSVDAQPGRQDAAPAARQPATASPTAIAAEARRLRRRPGAGAEGVRAVPRPAPHRPADAHPRRLPPGAAALHGQGLRHHRLRRAADGDAGGAPPQAQLAARRGRA